MGLKIAKFSPIYGNNIGDVMISKCIEKALVRKGVEVVSYDLLLRPPLSYKKRAVKNVLRIKLSTFLQLRFPRVFYLFKKILFFVRGDAKRFSRIMIENNFNTAIFGGGNILMNKMGSDYAFRASVYLKKVRHGYVYAAGAGPFDYEKRRLTKRIAERATFISVRDELSKNYFGEQAVVNIDPAFIVSDISPRETKGGVLGLNVISGFFSGQDRGSFAEAVIQLCNENSLSLRMINSAFPADEHEAVRFLEVVEQKSPQLRTECCNLSIEEKSVGHAYRDVDYFVGSRMHSLIFALSYGIPSLGFEWDKKVGAMLRVFFQAEDIEALLVKPAEPLDFSAYEFIDLPLAASAAKARVYEEANRLLESIRAGESRPSQHQKQEIFAGGLPETSSE